MPMLFLVSSMCLLLMLQSFIDRCSCCGCNGIYDASLQQHLRWWRWVLPVLPPPCLRSNQNKPHPASCEPWPYVICRPLQARPLKILLMTEPHPCLHIGHRVWISVNDPHSPTSWYTNAEKRQRTCENGLCVCLPSRLPVCQWICLPPWRSVRLSVSRGPEDTCFEGGVFPAVLSFPSDYPLSPPRMRFTCDMFHPNSKYWSPSGGL